MSDEEIRGLWRKATEESPATVKWIEAYLRTLTFSNNVNFEIPKFEHTFSIAETVLGYTIQRLRVSIPVNENLPPFQIKGMSILVNLCQAEDLSQLCNGVVRIESSHTYRIYEQLFKILLIPTSTLPEHPFWPGWIVDMTVPAATYLTAEFTNPLGYAINIRFAIHGSYL